MENNKQEEKKKFWKGIFLGAIGSGLIVLEICRKGQDIKWLGTKVKNAFQRQNNNADTKPAIENQNRQQKNDWNNKPRSRNN